MLVSEGSNRSAESKTIPPQQTPNSKKNLVTFNVNKKQIYSRTEMFVSKKNNERKVTYSKQAFVKETHFKNK